MDKIKDKVKIFPVRFDLASPGGRKAYDFLNQFGYSKSSFIVSLINWYIDNSDRYHLHYVNKGIEEINLVDELVKFGFTRQDSEHIVKSFAHDNTYFQAEAEEQMETEENITVSDKDSNSPSKADEFVKKESIIASEPQSLEDKPEEQADERPEKNLDVFNFENDMYSYGDDDACVYGDENDMYESKNAEQKVTFDPTCLCNRDR